jgi:hypothetical protein
LQSQATYDRKTASPEAVFVSLQMQHIVAAAIVELVQFVIAPVAVPYLKQRLTPKRSRNRKH